MLSFNDYYPPSSTLKVHTICYSKNNAKLYFQTVICYSYYHIFFPMTNLLFYIGGLCLKHLPHSYTYNFNWLDCWSAHDQLYHHWRKSRVANDLSYYVGTSLTKTWETLRSVGHIGNLKKSGQVFGWSGMKSVCEQLFGWLWSIK